MYEASATTVIQAPRQTVWDALTRPELVREYFFGTNLVTDWSIGSPVYFRGEWEGKPYEDRGTVLVFDPPRTLSFDYWSAFSGTEDRPELRQLVRYDLEEAGGGVRVTVRQSKVETEQAADRSSKNWQSVLDGMKALVERQKAS